LTSKIKDVTKFVETKTSLMLEQKALMQKKAKDEEILKKVKRVSKSHVVWAILIMYITLFWSLADHCLPPCDIWSQQGSQTQSVSRAALNNEDFF